jgi:hypothetical protein
VETYEETVRAEPSGLEQLAHVRSRSRS